MTACAQLADGLSTPSPGRSQTVTERIIDAVITAAADLNFDASDFPADWNVESFGDGDVLLQLLATDSDPSGNAVSALVERLNSAEAAEQALDDALGALLPSDTGSESSETIQLGDRGFIAPDGDGWVALFRVDNVIRLTISRWRRKLLVCRALGGPTEIQREYYRGDENEVLEATVHTYSMTDTPEEFHLSLYGACSLLCRSSRSSKTLRAWSKDA